MNWSNFLVEEVSGADRPPRSILLIGLMNFHPSLSNN
jgi:hypothetical protein